MKKSKSIRAQALACALLLSVTVIAMDSDRSGRSSPTRSPSFSLEGSDATPPGTPPRRIAPASPHAPASPTAYIPDRPWLYDGTKVVLCDIEGESRMGAPITEISLIEIRWGTATGRTMQYYFNPEGPVDHRFVSKIDPINPMLQPTFSDVADEIYEFIKDAIVVTYGPYDVRKLSELLGVQPPFGKHYEILWRDALGMARRDHARSLGKLITSPAATRTSFVSRPKGDANREYQQKRRAKRDKQEMADLKKYMASQQARAAGLPIPAPAARTPSIFDGVDFTQSGVARRKGISAKTGAASIGLDADQLNQKHRIPPEHETDHHAMQDTQTLAGIVISQGHKTIERRLRERNSARKPAVKRDARTAAGVENDDPAPSVAVMPAGKRARKGTHPTD